MAVYVDAVMPTCPTRVWPYAASCHMYADGLAELHAMAARLGLRPRWFQDRRVPHYDLTEGKRRQAVGLGAVQHTRREAAEYWRRRGWTRARGADARGGHSEGGDAGRPPATPVAAGYVQGKLFGGA